MLSFNKSSNPDFLNNLIAHKLDLLLKEQVEQRKDLSVINNLIHKLDLDKNLQKQVDEYFDADDIEHIPDSKQDLD